MDDEARHVGMRRNKVRIPKQRYDIHALPDVDFWPSNMTSSAKGFGLKECQFQGQHSLIRRQTRYRNTHTTYFVYCQRCGKLVDLVEI